MGSLADFMTALNADVVAALAAALAVLRIAV